MGKLKKAALQIGLIFVTAGAAAYIAAAAGAIGALRTIATVAKVLAISRGLSAISAALGPKPPQQIDPGQHVEYTGTVEPRRIIYGTVRVSGVNVLPAYTSGTKNEYLHQVLVLAGHECNAITDVFLGLEEVDTAAIGSITGAATDGAVTEVILATNFTAEGEATAHYLGESLRARGLRVSRIARGLPVGGELEYVDSGTLAQAFIERRPVT